MYVSRAAKALKVDKLYREMLSFFLSLSASVSDTNARVIDSNISAATTNYDLKTCFQQRAFCLNKHERILGDLHSACDLNIKA